jgi:hypothetical protein
MDIVQRQVREASHQIVQDGSVLGVLDSPARYDLVGALQWIDANHVMWFVAHGDSEADAHLLEFDRVQAVDTLGLCFLKDDRVIGYLAPIDAAQLEDPDDYRIGWQIWKEVSPLYDTMIERAFDRIEQSLAGDSPRAPQPGGSRHTAEVAA